MLGSSHSYLADSRYTEEEQRGRDRKEVDKQHKEIVKKLIKRLCEKGDGQWRTREMFNREKCNREKSEKSGSIMDKEAVKNA